MKHYYTLFTVLCLTTYNLCGQSIRKNYQEMTNSEKTALVNAFYTLRSNIPNGPADLINDLANFHGDNFSFGNSPQLDIHFNLPDEPQRQIFFAWHRQQMFEMEQAMQAINPNISLPWWDSSVDQSPNSPLWDQNFMGSFNNNWGLNRNLGGNGPLPTPADVATVQANTDFLVYSNNMERGTPHTGAHRWVGGAMPTNYSPRDPIFYLHHTYVDKLWSEWERAHPGSSSFIIQSMIRYDGTYVFNGQTLPLVNPNSIMDPNSRGVFYAENQLAQLNNYTVSNTYESLENFYYQFLIEIGNNFNVPAGTNCKVESVNEIRLIPGFAAMAGANFVAKIDSDNNVNTSAKRGISAPLAQVKAPFEDVKGKMNLHAYEFREFIADNIEINVYPNPFNDKIDFKMNKSGNTNTVKIYDMSGRVLLTKNLLGGTSFELNNLNFLRRGVYIVELISDYEVVLRKKVIKN